MRPSSATALLPSPAVPIPRVEYSRALKSRSVSNGVSPIAVIAARASLCAAAVSTSRRSNGPSHVETAAAHKLARAAMTAIGLTPFDTDRDFSARLYSTLGVGTAGDGSKAVALLGRIQAGQEITTVDALYKAMVLEEPDTFATALLPSPAVPIPRVEYS